VIVECDQCQAKYHYDEDRFAGKPSKKLRCSKCQAIFEVFNTRAYEAGPPVRPPITPGETMLRRQKSNSSADARATPREHPRAPRAPKLPEDQKLSLAVIAGPDPVTLKLHGLVVEVQPEERARVLPRVARSRPVLDGKPRPGANLHASPRRPSPLGWACFVRSDWRAAWRSAASSAD